MAEAQQASGLSEEVEAQIQAASDEIDGLNKEQLLERAESYGQTYENADDLNERWLKRKVKRLARSTILSEAGVDEAAVATEQPTEDKPAKKPGRKKMSTQGDFAIVLADGQSKGREGSTKYKIVNELSEVEKFNHARFKEAVVNAMLWTPTGGGENGDQPKFGITTKFPSIEAATNAWFSELKNKQEIIKPVGGQEEKPAEESQS